MTTYITVCVILFGIDALCKMFLLGVGRDGRSRVYSAIGQVLDTLLAIGMCGWGLALLLK